MNVDVIALGELLIDFVPSVSGLPLAQTPSFIKAAGGAPANVAVALTRLGVSSGFMGQVGEDAFGHFLADTLYDNGVDISALKFSKEARTALAFVALRADGERDFMFYRHPSADMLYRSEDVDHDYIRQARIFHFGSISLIVEPSRSATFEAVVTAQKAGLLVSYDPNLRMSLWPDSDAARTGMMSGWALANVIKVSEEEMAFLSGTDDIQDAAKKLWHNRLKLLLVTRGGEGVCYFTPQFNGACESFKVSPVDTTGAGDGFVGGLLRGLLTHPEALSSESDLREVCKLANAVGALTTTQRGAIPSLPRLAQVDEFITSHAAG